MCINDLPSTKRDWWLIIEPTGNVDLCWANPGFEVDLFGSTDLRTMTSIWMGVTDVVSEREKFEFTGSRDPDIAGAQPIFGPKKIGILRREG